MNINDTELYLLNDIIANLYSQKNFEKAIGSFFEKLQGLVYFDKGDVCLFRNAQEERVCELFAGQGWENSEVRDYHDKFYALDDTLPILITKQPIMFRSSDLFIDAERNKNEYISEFLLPAQIKHSIEGNLFLSEDNYFSGIAIHRYGSRDDFSQKDVEIMRLLRPHLANKLKMYKNTKYNNYMFVPFLTDMNDIGVLVWDFNLNLTKTNLNNNFLPKEIHAEILRKMNAMCAAFRNQIIHYGPGENRIRKRISTSLKSYFIDISFLPDEETGKGHFMGIVYDYVGIFTEIMKRIKIDYRLTEREYEVLECVLYGMSNQEIAEKLFVTLPTVKKHLANIYSKMDVEGRNQIIRALF